MQPRSLKSRILAPFLAAILVFLAIAALQVQGVAELLRQSDEQTRLSRVHRELQAARLAALEAEAASRDSADVAAAEATRHLTALDSLYADDHEALQRLAAIRRQLQAGQPPAATVPAPAGDVFRTQFAALQSALDAHDSALQEAMAQSRQALWQCLWTLLGLVGLMLLAACWACLREGRARDFLAERLQYETVHDNLTGLPNRRFFNQWLERALAQARRERRQLALLYLDLDGFRRVNDTLGHEIADRLLRVAARRFRDSLRESDVLARLGADEFVILTPVTDAAENAGVLAERLIASLREPLLPQFSDRCAVGASIGVALYPRDAATPDTLVLAAEEAMQAAKREGRNHHRFHGRDDGQPA